ncbi:MAG: Gmad2 immunoglobulin-like domain-containing protein [Mycobacteriales bacterium]
MASSTTLLGIPLCLAATLLAGCTGTTLEASSGTPSVGAPVAAPPAAAPSVPAAGPPASARGRRAVAVYYLADTGATGPRLYREFHLRPATSAVVRDAVDAMLHEAPYDASYVSLWPRDTKVLGVTITGGLATVNLSRQALGGSAGSTFEVASLQQLGWTVTGAAPAVTSVQVLIEGRSSGIIGGREIADFWGAGGLATQPLRRAPQFEVLGPVWVLSPTPGAVVGPDVTIAGTESVFEGTVNWEVRAGTTVVRHGFVTGVGAPGRGTWSAHVRLAPGSYVVRAWEASAKDGSVTFLDDKAFRVR